ncbi:MAG: glycosyltransferase [Sphingobacteriales bacterium]|jgi:glycosyltransferase involved in cell wall biosynthesis|nr:MAG: glycosyltransferase [Sphingobacteriales bacterium]
MKITIITVCYNAQNFISQCVQSVLNQDYSNIEYIVIDGNSQDNTLAILKQYGTGIDVLISEPDKGIYDAINKGIALATGNCIGVLHADDFYAHANVLSQVAKAFMSHPIDILYGNLDYVSRINHNLIVRKWRSHNYSDFLLENGWMPAHPTFYAKKECFLKYGNYDICLTSAADYDLMLRFLYKTPLEKFFLNLVMVKMRTGGASNITFKNRWLANRQDYHSLKKNNIPFPFKAILFKPFRKILQFF